MTVTSTAPLTRSVGITFPQAVQILAACEDRIREYQGYANRGADVAFVVSDLHIVVAQLREAFGLWPRSEADLDAAHEAFTFDPAEGSPDPLPDIPVALDTYWNRSA